MKRVFFSLPSFPSLSPFPSPGAWGLVFSGVEHPHGLRPGWVRAPGHHCSPVSAGCSPRGRLRGWRCPGSHLGGCKAPFPKLGFYGWLASSVMNQGGLRFSTEGRVALRKKLEQVFYFSCRHQPCICLWSLKLNLVCNWDSPFGALGYVFWSS